MKIIKFKTKDDSNQLAAVKEDGSIYPLPYEDFLHIIEEAEKHAETCLSIVKKAIEDAKPIQQKPADLQLMLPLDAYEVWASGVTYLKSKNARNYEAYEGKEEVSDSYYDKVYDAERPEIFLKSTGRRTIGPDKPVYLRNDSDWQIPEPELGLVLNKHGRVVGYTVGNDMSSRDIEGENPLYLPQAKIWKHSCSFGPAIRLAETVENPYDLTITCKISRGGEKIFEESASTSQLKRKYEELVEYLKRDNELFDGTVLFTGTCIIPANDFTLADGDLIEITIPEVGTLSNPVEKLVIQDKTAIL
ncbi:fumarylacetoacetate hydrolase family protein [Halobacillus salinarum]|uniref:Fumarylacetoacetate hydrolase family protein n=1 Tax=Halobacillus salinarum TaxID=2932257 RepID=A0ABY4EHT4_9BACI|nr:fumarylacetoacetate hydrolase family protein [Halobacillus salinarum]UOQ44031.1 fumarylacetoacetate hydrolase family protein [Halobacillus salinarum]